MCHNHVAACGTHAAPHVESSVLVAPHRSAWLLRLLLTTVGAPGHATHSEHHAPLSRSGPKGGGVLPCSREARPNSAADPAALDAQVDQLREALESSTHLRTLSLRRCCIGGWRRARAIARGLAFNRSLTSVDLSYNGLGAASSHPGQGPQQPALSLAVEALCQARPWHAHGTSMARPWHVHGTHTARPWHAHGTPMAHTHSTLMAHTHSTLMAHTHSTPMARS